jgi:hypothetical protein
VQQLKHPVHPDNQDNPSSTYNGHWIHPRNK